MIIQRALLYALILCNFALTPAGAAAADGSLRITFAWRDGSNQPTEAWISGSAYAPSPLPGNIRARLLAEDGGELWRGRLRLERRLSHDTPDARGELRGGVGFFNGPLWAEVPHIAGATTLELRAPGDGARRYPLAQLMRRKIAAPAVHAAEPVRSPDFSAVVRRVVAPGRERLSLRPARIATAATQKLSLVATLAGVAENEKKSARVTVRIHDPATGDLLATRTYNPFKRKNYAIVLPQKPLTIHASAKTSRGRLYPGDLLLTGYTPGAGPVDLAFSSQATIEGNVSYANSGTPARIIIAEEDHVGLLRSSSYTSLETNADGTFSLLAPSRKLAFVIIPQDTRAEQSVAVRSVRPNKKTGISRQNFVLQPAGTFGSSTRYYLLNNGPDIARYTFVFLSSGYTAYQEPFADENGNGVWDGDYLLDENNNGQWDSGERFRDRNLSGIYDRGEPFTDLNGDTICNRDERAEFVLTAAWMTAKVLDFAPFDRYADSFNVYACWVPSQHSIARLEEFPAPYNGFSTAFDVSGNSQSVYGYRGKFQLYTSANWGEINTAAYAAIPDHQFWIVLMRDPLNVMISNSAIMQSAADHRDGRVLIHEMGHHVGGLADEYIYTGSQWALYSGPEPYYPNLTIETNPELVKWSRYFEGPVTVPTPEGTAGYGLFEGGSWVAGVFRPTSTSMMRSTSEPFYKVNEDALAQALERFK